MTINDTPRLTTPDAPAADESDQWLPERCPPWCDQEHAQALAEGCGWWDSQEHIRSGYGDTLPEVRNCIDKRVMRPGRGGWNMVLAQRDRGPSHGALTTATIRVTFDDPESWGKLKLDLLPGEARTLSAQHVAMADMLDMPDCSRRNQQ